MKALFFAIFCAFLLSGCGGPRYVIVDGAQSSASGSVTLPPKPNAKCDGYWELTGSEWTCRATQSTVYVAPTVHPWFWGLPYAYAPVYPAYGFNLGVCVHCGRGRWR